MTYAALLSAVTEIVTIEVRTKLELEAIGEKFKAEMRQIVKDEFAKPNNDKEE